VHSFSTGPFHRERGSLARVDGAYVFVVFVPGWDPLYERLAAAGDAPHAESAAASNPRAAGADGETVVTGRTPPGGLVVFRSGDGLHFDLVTASLAADSTCLDSSAAEFDPLRGVWVFVLKENFLGWVRVQRRFEAPGPVAAWGDYLACERSVTEASRTPLPVWRPCIDAVGRANASVYWLAADDLDRAYDHGRDYYDQGLAMGADADPFRRDTDLYGAGLAAYESVTLAFLAVHWARDRFPKEIDIHLGTSRDGGWAVHRPEGRSPFLDNTGTVHMQNMCSPRGIVSAWVRKRNFYCF
jgi:hypothetical protein